MFTITIIFILEYCHMLVCLHRESNKFYNIALWTRFWLILDGVYYKLRPLFYYILAY